MAAAQLGDREGAILKAIVERYVSTARPVSSGVLVRDGVVRLSPATVRNVMRTLENAHLISQPHTSAGRVPTDAGYRYYVDRLMTPESPAERVRRTVDTRVVALAGRDLGVLASEVSRLVSELSEELAMTVTPPVGGVIERIELVGLASGGVLAVATATGGATRTRALLDRRRVSAADIARANDLLVAWLRGVAPAEARGVLASRRARRGERFPADVAALLEEAESLFALDDEAHVRYEGAMYMFRHPEFHDRAWAVGRVIDCEIALEEVLGAAQKPGEVTVRIGHENRRRGLEAMSLVVGAYRIAGGLGRVAVIGPTRMRYPRLVGLVRLFSEALDRLLAGEGR